MALNNFFAPTAPGQISNFRSNLIDSGFDTINPVSSARYPLAKGGFTNEPVSVPTGNPGVLVHTCDGTAIDEVFLWCGNYSSNDVTLTLGLGGFTDSQTISIEIPKNAGLVQIYPGVPHANIDIFAKASAANALNIVGFVTRKYLNVSGNTEFGYDASE